MNQECSCGSTMTLEEWVRRPAKNPEMCHDCMLPITVGWYEDVLRERGATDLLDQLQQQVINNSSVTAEGTARVMDQIKASAPPDIRERLRQLDCMTQCADY